MRAHVGDYRTGSTTSRETARDVITLVSRGPLNRHFLYFRIDERMRTTLALTRLVIQCYDKLFRADLFD